MCASLREPPLRTGLNRTSVDATPRTERPDPLTASTRHSQSGRPHNRPQGHPAIGLGQEL
jgi:hypothetical protein